MKAKRWLAFLLLVYIISGQVVLNEKSINCKSSIDIEISQNKLPTTAHLPHARIDIEGNEELRITAQTEGWSGNGSESNPFVIEGFYFSNVIVGISIKNTSFHFEIRDCLFEQIGATGVYFHLVENGVISNSTFEVSQHEVVMVNTQNCVIKNITSTNSSAWGLMIYSCINFIIEDSTIVAQSDGIWIHDCQGGIIRRNILTSTGLLIEGDDLEHWIHNISDNTVGGKPLGYFRSTSDFSVNMSSYGQMIVIECSNITMIGGAFCDQSVAIYLGYSNSSIITDVLCLNQETSVSIFNSQDCIIMNSTLEACEDAVRIYQGEDCQVLNNTIQANGNGVDVWQTPGVIIANNTIGSGGLYGITIAECEYSVLSNNSISEYSEAILFVSSSNCLVLRNLLNHNTEGVLLWDSNLIRSEDNSICFNRYGVAIYESSDCELIQNTIDFNDNYGVYISDSENCVLRNNSIRFTNNTGILSEGYSLSCEIAYNNITLNEEFGVEFGRGVYNFRLYGNILGWNGIGNAIDNGQSNTWDDGVSLGNTWDNYLGGPYHYIPGEANSFDRFPSVIEDIHPPGVIIDHNPTTPIFDDDVIVTAQIVDTSAMSEVILFYSIDSGNAWTNITMVEGDIGWNALIPRQQVDTIVLYKVYAMDIHGYSSWSIVKGYSVQSEIPTTTTETPPTTDMSTTTPTPPNSFPVETPSIEILILSFGIGALSGVIILMTIAIIHHKFRQP